MTSAVWRPNRRETYPVLGVEGYCGDLVEAVVELPATGPNLITVPVEDIRVSPTRSIVRSLTSTFHDHSRIDRCRCAGSRGRGFSQAQAVAQTGVESAAPVTNFPHE